MRKPLELRQHLEAALPALRHAPDKLKLFVEAGRILTSGTDKLAWMYAYTVQLQFLDWGEHPDTVIAPLLIWLRQHQFDVVDNKDKKGIRFNAEFLDALNMAMALSQDWWETQGQDGVFDEAGRKLNGTYHKQMSARFPNSGWREQKTVELVGSSDASPVVIGFTDLKKAKNG